MASQSTQTSSTRGPSLPPTSLLKTPPAAIGTGLRSLPHGRTEGAPCHGSNQLLLIFKLASNHLIKSTVSVPCRTFLHFEAVNNAMYAWVNGQLLGYSQDSCLPAEFEVTHLLRQGATCSLYRCT